MIKNHTITEANPLIDRWLRQFIYGRPSIAYAVCSQGLVVKIANEHFFSVFVKDDQSRDAAALADLIPELRSSEAYILDVMEGKQPLYVHGALLQREVDGSEVPFHVYVQHLPGVGDACLFVALPVHARSSLVELERQVKMSFELAEEEMTEADQQLLSSLLLDREFREFQGNVLEENRARMAAILNAVSDGIIAVDHDATIRSVNPAVVSLWGYGRKELIGRNVSMLFEEGSGMERIPALLDLERDSLPQDVVRTVKTLAVRADKEKFPAEVAINRVDHPGSVAFVAVARDISQREQREQERKRILEEVRHSKERLASLTKRLLIAQEEERRRVALDLHDELGSRISNINFGLDRVKRQLGSQKTESVDNLQDQLVEITEIVRHLSFSLRPEILDDYGLLEACDWLVGTFQKEAGIRVDFDYSGIDMDDRFSSLTEIVAFRIIQESLTNVSKHAETSECLLRINLLDDTLLLSIIDRGVGFDVSQALDDGATVGLLGMVERVKQLDGKIKIESNEEGTQVLVEIPVSGPEKEKDA